MSNPEEIQRLKEVFREAVNEGSSGSVLHLDPDRFTGDMEQDLQSLVKQQQEQFPDTEPPNYTDPSSDTYLNRDVAEELVELSRNKKGPFAIPIDESSCIVNGINKDLVTKEEIVSFTSGVKEEHLKPLPGEDDDYVKMVADHEGTHCEQPSKLMVHRETLPRETHADLVAQGNLERAGKPEVAQVFKDVRALAAEQAPSHATGVPLDPKNIPDGITKDHQKAAAEYRGEINEQIAGRLGVTVDEVAMMREDTPKLYRDLTQRVLDEGALDDKPLEKAYAEDYLEAQDRRINEKGMSDKNIPEKHIKEVQDWLDEEDPEIRADIEARTKGLTDELYDIIENRKTAKEYLSKPVETAEAKIDYDSGAPNQTTAGNPDYIAENTGVEAPAVEQAPVPSSSPSVSLG